MLRCRTPQCRSSRQAPAGIGQHAAPFPHCCPSAYALQQSCACSLGMELRTVMVPAGDTLCHMQPVHCLATSIVQRLTWRREERVPEKIGELKESPCWAAAALGPWFPHGRVCEHSSSLNTPRSSSAVFMCRAAIRALRPPTHHPAAALLEACGQECPEQALMEASYRLGANPAQGGRGEPSRLRSAPAR